MPDFDSTPFAQAREDIRDLVSIPLQAWMLVPPARRTDKVFSSIVAIPLDLAAADFSVNVAQTDQGWYVEVSKHLAPKVRLHLAGRARSYLSALYQLADSADLALRDLEKQARKNHAKAQESEVAA